MTMAHDITVKDSKGNQILNTSGYDVASNVVSGSNPPVYLYPATDLSNVSDGDDDMTVSPNEYHLSGTQVEGGMIKRFEMMDGGGGND